jgi:three-Cys-motif partner protein
VASVTPEKFFDERKDQSEAKTRIVTKYFIAWSSIIRGVAQQRDNRIAYVDLYAGPGRYRDGAASTPLEILEATLKDSALREMLVTIFNDGDSDVAGALAGAIAGIKNISDLKFKPQIWNEPISEALVRRFAEIRLIPTFSFFDPFGYKGLSLNLFKAFIKDWGCDTVFFFNYNRINAGAGNLAVAEHIDAFFGVERANSLRHALAGKTPSQREALILEELAAALRDMGGKFVLPFRFMADSGKRPTHYLVFVSKHIRGYEVMKDIMYTESSSLDQGVASFAYSPADAITPLLFSLNRPLEGLGERLVEDFSGQTLPLIDIFRPHHADSRFVLRNYRDAIRELEGCNRVTCDPPQDKRRKIKGVVSLAEHVRVSFPHRKAN